MEPNGSAQALSHVHPEGAIPPQLSSQELPVPGPGPGPGPVAQFPPQSSPQDVAQRLSHSVSQQKLSRAHTQSSQGHPSHPGRALSMQPSAVGSAQEPSIPQLRPAGHSPQEPPHPSFPQFLLVQSGMHPPRHVFSAVQVKPGSQIPQIPPHPSAPHSLPAQ